MSKKEDLTVKVSDVYGKHCLKDKICGVTEEQEDNSDRRPRGFVEIFEIDQKTGKEKKVSKSNLIVYLGREWLAQRIFNVINTLVSPRPNEYICWIGIGDGGVAAGDPLNPIIPINTDSDLYSEVLINATDTDCSDPRGPLGHGSYYKHPLDEVTFEQDLANDNSYIIAKVKATIGSDDANGSILSEAGLFIAASDAGGDANTGPFYLFSRVTFPAIVKNTNRILVFMWYIYC